MGDGRGEIHISQRYPFNNCIGPGDCCMQESYLRCPWLYVILVYELFKKLNNQEEECELLQNSRLGGKALKEKWDKMTSGTN
jgi:hypothetical protein